ncbi:MAG: pyridoxamine 5'-phosphate oxidase family protein [Deltaproteobacteria bacterium]|jgi:uncharacterized pyridoxamine 5'-phosphate oxidase family protein|nr:pyridoxamine 5'-phosphate oxidase family protein [Deltaproteobacteria bacterium]
MSKEVFDFLAANRPFYLATVDDGVPKVRPMGFVMLHEDRLWLGMGSQKNVFRQIKANPKIEIAATNPEGQATSPEGQWIRISGTLTFDERPELFALAVEVMPMLKDIYPGDGPKMAIGWVAGEASFFNAASGGVVKTVKLG